MTGPTAWLHLPQGESYQRLYAFLPWWLLASLALAGAAAAVWALIRTRVHAAWGRCAAPLTPPAAGGLVLLCALIVAACDGSGLMDGFFRQDDFSFLQVAREVEGVGRQLLLIHNDHLCPLYRLETWMIASLAGPDASTATLAAWFNAVTFLSCLGLLLAGCWVLHELGASRLALLSFALFTWMWPGWGEFTAGYFSCCSFLQILALGFAATAAMLRGFQRGSTAWLAISLLLATGAAATDVSGVHVFLTLAIPCLAWNWRRIGTPAVRRYLLVLAPWFVAVFVFYFLVARHAQTPREFVQNPQGTSLSIAKLADNLLRHPLSAGLAALSTPGGLLLSVFTPTFLQRAVVNESVPAGLSQGFLAAEIMLLALLAVAVPKVWRRLPGDARAISAALATNALLILGMAIAARTGYATSVPVPLWHARYLMMPVAWLMLALVYIIDRLWLSHPRPPARAPVLLYTAMIASGWFVASCWHFEKTLLPQPMAYIARGRWGNVRNARERAAEYRAVLADLVAIADHQKSHHITLPAPDRWARSYYDGHSILEWGSDYTPRGVTYLFWDLPAAAPGLRLYGRWAPPADFPPASREFLIRYPWLAAAFAPP